MNFLVRLLSGGIIPVDKMLHFFVALSIGLILKYSFGFEWMYYTVVLVVLTIGKEWFDLKIKKSKFDWMDVLAGCLSLFIVFIS